jgi:hypothetical protein
MRLLKTIAKNYTLEKGIYVSKQNAFYCIGINRKNAKAV